MQRQGHALMYSFNQRLFGFLFFPCALVALTDPVRMLRRQQVSHRIVREGGRAHVYIERCILAL